MCMYSFVAEVQELIMERTGDTIFSYDSISGYVQEIISCNLQSQYVEFKVRWDRTNQDVYIVGKVQHAIAVGVRAHVGGKWLDRQIRKFLASKVEISIPSYMQIEVFSDYNSETQLQAKSKRDKKFVHQRLLEQAVIYDTTILSKQFKLPSNCAKKLYALYKEKAPSVILNNPYKLAYEAQIISFEHAERIAMKLGMYRHQSTARIEAGLKYTLLTESLKKNFSVSSLIASASTLLSTSEELVVEVAAELIKEQQILLD